MRVGVVDIGSNSTRLLIAKVQDDRVVSELERRSTVTRLGSGVDSNDRLSEDAIERVYATLDDYRSLIDRHRADTSMAVLTSAVRDAANGPQFVEEVRRRYHLHPHLLTGDQEARLTFLGATSDCNPGDAPPTLVIDIGGGSTELVIGMPAGSHGDLAAGEPSADLAGGEPSGDLAAGEPSFHVSTQAGVVRQTERHIRNDPPSADEIDALGQDVRSVLAQAVPQEQRRRVEHAIAVAGTATSLAAIAQELEPYDPEKAQGYLLSEAECRRILGELARLPLAERMEIKGLHPDRAPTIIAGVVILLEALALFGLEQVEVSENDLLRGAALALRS